jgi:hypothetical protein
MLGTVQVKGAKNRRIIKDRIKWFDIDINLLSIYAQEHGITCNIAFDMSDKLRDLGHE